MEVLKVSAKSNPNSVAGALAGVIRGAGQRRAASHWRRCLESGSKSSSNRARICSAQWN